MISEEKAKEFSVVILSAGKSSRMGKHKALLDYDSEYCFLQKIVSEYIAFGCLDVLVVVNTELKKQIEKTGLNLPGNSVLVENKHPEWHRFYSLKEGVNCLNRSSAVFVHNVDNPFVNHKVLEQLLIKLDAADYIIPDFNGSGGHPFLISSKVVEDLKNSESDQMHLKEFLNQYTKQRVSVTDEKVLVNINTYEEYRKFFSLKF